MSFIVDQVRPHLELYSELYDEFCMSSVKTDNDPCFHAYAARDHRQRKGIKHCGLRSAGSAYYDTDILDIQKNERGENTERNHLHKSQLELCMREAQHTIKRNNSSKSCWPRAKILKAGLLQYAFVLHPQSNTILVRDIEVYDVYQKSMGEDENENTMNRGW